MTLIYLRGVGGRLANRLKNLIGHLRLAPYDVTTPDGRSSERIRLLSWATLTAGVSKVGSLLIVLASVRWGVGYLGVERFGLWMTITSIITLLSFADFGISNSLVNSVSAAAGKNDTEAMRRDISNGFAIMALVALVLGLVFFLIYFLIDWGAVTNVIESTSILEAGPAFAAYVAIFLISLPLSVVQRVQIGLQESWRSNLWTFVGQLLALIGLALVVHLDGGVPYLVMAVAGIPVVVTAINYIDYFFRLRRDICPHLVDIHRATAKRLTHVSMLFMLMQFMAVIGNASDNIIIAQFLGAAAVSPFAIMQKLTMILSLAPLFITPMWPTFGEAMARGDHVWARRALTNILTASLLLGILAGLIILVFGVDITAIWAGRSMVPNESLLVGFAAFSILMSIGGSLSVFLNNGEYLRRQALIYIVASIMSILLKFVLVAYWQDASGAIWGNVIGYSVFFIVPALFIAYSSKTNSI
jgi:O-antigen/teichoic acid export membrane protein